MFRPTSADVFLAKWAIGRALLLKIFALFLLIHSVQGKTERAQYLLMIDRAPHHRHSLARGRCINGTAVRSDWLDVGCILRLSDTSVPPVT